MWAEELLSLMDDIFHWATWEWRTCFLFRAQRAQPSHFLAKAFGKEHSSCPSKHSEDIWVHIWQMGSDGSACSCPRSARVGLGIVAKSKAVKGWVNTCMISPHQGMWPGLLSLHGIDSKALLVYTSPKKKQFGVLVLQLLTWLAITQAKSLGSCFVCFRAFPTLGFVLLWQERGGMVTPEDFCTRMCLGLFKPGKFRAESTNLLLQCEASMPVLNQSWTAHPGRWSKCFVRELVLQREAEKVPGLGLVFHTESFQITYS